MSNIFELALTNGVYFNQDVLTVDDAEKALKDGTAIKNDTVTGILANVLQLNKITRKAFSEGKDISKVYSLSIESCRDLIDKYKIEHFYPFLVACYEHEFVYGLVK